jgi:hypothetical protein
MVDHKMQMQSGWNVSGASIMMIPYVDDGMIHLVQNHCQLKASSVADFIVTFIGQDTHQAQNDVQLYYCIANTLDAGDRLLNLYLVNTSGKTGAQIPHPPLEDESSPWGR